MKFLISSTTKKVSIFFAVIMCFGFLIAIPSSADTIKDRISQTQGVDGISVLESTIDESTSTAVEAGRRIGVTITIIFGLYLAFVYLRAGFSPDTLRETKGRILLFFVFLAFCFFTEQILGFVFGILGIDLSEL